MTYLEGAEAANAKVDVLILKILREGKGDLQMSTDWRARRAIRDHLAQCPETKVLELEAYDGMYGCDTGCEYARLEAKIGCPHQEAVLFKYGAFGELADLIEQLT